MEAHLPSEKIELDQEKKVPRNNIHGLHKYYGKLIPAIPSWAIKKYTEPEDIILDPFCGSGTTLVEAQINQRNSFGVDIDPLAILISKVKTTPIDKADLVSTQTWLFEQIENDNGSDYEKDIPLFKYVDLNYWFSPSVIRDLTIIRRNIIKIHDEKIRDFFLVCFSSIIRKVYLGDPNQIKPCKTWYVKGKRDNINAVEVFKKEVPKKIKLMGDFHSKLKSFNNRVFAEPLLGDARKLHPKVKDIDLIVTNPPYVASLDYIRANKLEGWWTGAWQDYQGLRKNLLGSERARSVEYNHLHKTGINEIDKVIKKIYSMNRQKAFVTFRFFDDMKKVMSEWKKVLNPSAKIVIKISDSRYQHVLIPTPKFFLLLGKKFNFEPLAVFKDKIRSYSLTRVRHPTGGLITHDWILVLENKD